ncbi:MAG: TIGR03546 family protein [Planctomycetaceae bacterium]
MLFILRPIRLTLRAVLTEAKPGQLALGFAMGVLIGVVPKSNLIAVVLSFVLASLRANLAIAAATALVVSFVAGYLDPLSDRIGSWLLTHPALQETWTHLYNQPVMPWTDFNNSIVLGSLVIGLILVYPAFRLSRPLFAKYTVKMTVWAKKFWLTRLLLGVELTDRFAAVN